MIRFIRNARRLFGMGRILARHDALFPLTEVIVLGDWLDRALKLGLPQADPGLRPGQKIANALEELGPAFIKLGQSLATRSDLLGEQMAEDLTALQDRLAPFPTETAKADIEAELNLPFEQLFKTFEVKPVAAASIAQVHFAETIEGREVAVKVLRPGIEKRLERDLDLFFWLAEWAEFIRPKLRRLKPVETVRALEDSVKLEMDLRFEAAAASEFAENFADDDSVAVPEIDWERTGRRVLTMERVSGLRFDDRAGLEAAGIDPTELLSRAAQCFFRQVFIHGFFHADMHAGNIFISPQGKMIIIDFGIMGRVDIRTRRYLAETLIGFLTQNYQRVAEVHFEAGFVPAHKPLDVFRQACRSIGEPILGKESKDISIGRLLGQLFAITETFEMETQPQLLMLQKTMVVAEGNGRILNPNVNMWELARPLIEEWVADHLGPQAQTAEMFKQARNMALRMPKIIEAADLLTHEGVRVHPDSLKAMEKTSFRRRKNGIQPYHLLVWGAMIILAVVALLD